MEPRLDEYGSLTKRQRNWLRVPAPLPRRSRRRPYEREEDVAILRFFMEAPRRLLVARGRAIWQEAERALGPGRTWQSLKERFLKSIVPNCERYAGEDVPEPFCDEVRRVLLDSDTSDCS
ncbi:telomeric repeat-binding factor 2-interacting protein 1-like [Pollicipes pollicipes]|uniref:telomeric repeat-binding factor 2-interacting protein 1-like n=1 Tax=Pollicipes pollicipes TaxID=41117 RepID=UPI00188552BD|nr:telomeric repeat-binding factor 2-interacting protein 1-like [Pollicipes pollicipes]